MPRSRLRSVSSESNYPQKRIHKRKQHRSRSRDRTRSRSRDWSRSHPRRVSRSRAYHKSRERSNRRSRSRESSVKQALQTIVSRLNAIEESSASVPQTPPRPAGHSTSQNVSVPSTTQTLTEILSMLNPAKSHCYYVSNFDPAIHDIEVWCEEVERAKVSNHWNDYECLSRVSNCLKGDAKSWLSEDNGVDTHAGLSTDPPASQDEEPAQDAATSDVPEDGAQSGEAVLG